MEQRASGMYAPARFSDHLTQMRHGAQRWEQGDHILIAAPTKAGKTTLMSKLIGMRGHKVIFVTKQKDETFAREFKDWDVLREWPKGGPPPWMTHILLWPKAVKYNKAATIANQRRVFHNALERINSEGNRTVVFDETLYLTDPKLGGLGNWLSYLAYHGRSSGITLVALTQRPAWIPVIVYSSVTHAYIARTRDRNDTKRLADMGGIDTKEVAGVLQDLPTRHDYVYLNPQGDAVPSIVNTRK